ncbi:MAG: NAD(P)H-binding protein [Gammaproteobacteria bacterium]|nr:NAD(P)H-binding protein [Gammaproteobacteria bacterium]
MKRLSRLAVVGLFTTLAALAGHPVQAAEPGKIVVYGANGNIGSKIVAEALNRGYTVVGVSRHPGPAGAKPNSRYSAVSGDILDVNDVVEKITGANAVVVSVGGYSPDNTPENSTLNMAAQIMISASRRLGDDAPRIFQVGGATTLNPSLEDMKANMPFPAPEGTAVYAMLFGHWEALQRYRAASDIQWTVVTPALSITPGQRTGKFRLASDTAIRDAKGNSAISQEDFAVAIINELENPQFIGKRFTVGY